MSAVAKGLGPPSAFVSGHEQGAAGKAIEHPELTLICMLKLQAEA